MIKNILFQLLRGTGGGAAVWVATEDNEPNIVELESVTGEEKREKQKSNYLTKTIRLFCPFLMGYYCSFLHKRLLPEFINTRKTTGLDSNSKQ